MVISMEVYKQTAIVDEEAYWQAVVEKDAAFDGVFFVAVRSTGVYCRPICPSRQPRRDRVTFFRTPVDAEAGGFRACLRCEPRREGPSHRELMVQEASRILDREDQETVTLAQLGKRLQVSPYHLQRTFKSVLGVTPLQYVKARRLTRLKQQLRQGASVTDAMYDAGYGSSSRLYETSDSTLGMTPGRYGRGGYGMRISYMIADSPLGRLLVAVTERGVCAVNMGDSDVVLEAGLRREYPAAEILSWSGGGREGMALWLEMVVNQVADGKETIDLPLDLRVSAFQAKVYSELRNIPRGETRSYGEVARAIGQPRATRAVGNACHTNPVPLVVPCHRVIAGDGSIGGYGGGLERKRKLLAQEGATIPKEAKAAG